MLRNHLIERRLGALLLGLIVAACGDASTAPGDVAVTGVTVTAAPNPAELTVEVQTSAQVVPADAPQTVTWSSSDETVATVDASGTVTLKLRGTVTITATSTSDPTKSGSVTLTVVCPDPRLVTANIADDTTWEDWVPDPECFDYVVQTNLELNATVLTIEPGTAVGFEEDLRLRVRTDAALNAAGTDEKPIRLSGTTEERGFWWGVSIEGTDNPDNLMTYTTMEYAGGDGISFNEMEPANLRLVRSSVFPIQNSTFRQSAAYGIAIDFQVDVPDAADNTMTENALGSAYVFGSEVPNLNGASLTGNDVDVVAVRPDAIGESALWPPAVYHILYYSQQAFTVTAGTLTLSSGSELRFEADQSMVVTGDGRLTAEGTAAAPILFTGTEAVPGHWGGLGILQTGDGENHLDHVVIEYGGGLSIASRPIHADLVISHSGGGVQATITNTTLRDSEEYGLFAVNGASLVGFENNALTGNALGPAYVDAPVVADLTPSNSFIGNGADEIAVSGGATNPLTEETTWQDLGVPYYVQAGSGTQTSVQASFTLKPGVDLLFEPNVGVAVTDGGSLVAEGTSTEHITMGAKAGPWQGVEFLNTIGSLDYLDISDAGSTKWGQVDVAGAITIVAASPGTSLVYIKGSVEVTDSPYSIVFSHGDAIATGCPGAIYIPPPDMVSDHCRPPT